MEKLKREAEAEMRRKAPDLEGGASKKQRMEGDPGSPPPPESLGLLRYDYNAQHNLAQGSVCFLGTTSYQRCAVEGHRGGVWGMRRDRKSVV